MKTFHGIRGIIGCGTTLTMLAVSVSNDRALAQTISPKHVINLNRVVPGGFADWRVADVTQSNGRWAVLLRPMQRNSGSAIVTGDSSGQRVAMQIGAFDRIVMDRNHVIYLRHASSRRDVTEISRWKAETDELETQTIADVHAEPTVSDGMVHWKAHGSSGGHRGRLAPGEQELSIPEVRLVLGLPGQRYMVFGTRTEEIMVFDASGALVGTARADLDSAYGSLGMRVPKPDVQTGRRRVVSAASSRDGSLYVQLSETPVSLPAPIAIFNPTNGRFLRMLNAIHPTAEGITGADDLTPVGLPHLGAVDDQLVIVYSKGYVAIY